MVTNEIANALINIEETLNQQQSKVYFLAKPTLGG